VSLSPRKDRRDSALVERVRGVLEGRRLPGRGVARGLERDGGIVQVDDSSESEDEGERRRRGVFAVPESCIILEDVPTLGFGLGLGFGMDDCGINEVTDEGRPSRETSKISEPALVLDIGPVANIGNVLGEDLGATDTQQEAPKTMLDMRGVVLTVSQEVVDYLPEQASPCRAKDTYDRWESSSNGEGVTEEHRPETPPLSDCEEDQAGITPVPMGPPPRGLGEELQPEATTLLEKMGPCLEGLGCKSTIM
jgi:hypothetical protein